MTILQAYRRTKNHDVAFGRVILKFKPNELGHVICDVEDPKLVEKLLNIPTGFRLYGDAVAPEPASPLLSSPPPDVPKLVITKNERGHIVAVTHQDAEGRILKVLAESAPFDAVPAASAPAGEIPTPKPTTISEITEAGAGEATRSPYLLIDGTGAEYDLRPLDDAKLHAFAAANGVKVHPNAKGDTIRDKIVAHFAAAAE